MFTGLVERTAEVVSVKTSGLGRKLQVDLGKGDWQPGSSVAVNGVCLTVVHAQDGVVTFDLNQETQAISNLSRLQEGNFVNIELPLHWQQRLDGHVVLGHVDGMAEVVKLEPQGEDWMLTVKLPAEAAAFVIPKGSLSLDGVSLTINQLRDLNDGCVEVRMCLIPTTMQITNFSDLYPGYPINFETDIIGKYLVRQQNMTSVISSHKARK